MYLFDVQHITDIGDIIKEVFTSHTGDLKDLYKPTIKSSTNSGLFTLFIVVR